MNRKILVIIFCVVLVVAVFEGRFFFRKNIESPQINKNDIGDWKIYHDNSFEFKYPGILTLDQQDDKIVLNHFINYHHPNPCDFKGDALQLEKITDFNLSFKIFDKNLKDTIGISEGSDYIIKNFFQDKNLKTSPGFIDDFSIGTLKGYLITSGVEGCGRFAYYFPLSQNTTLVATRAFIPEFQPIIVDYQTYSNLPGIISPNQEEDFFNKILSSFLIIQ